ncbi:MAG: dTDP-4-dehydrorhamnose 3,5-epimerase [Chitinophagales bacterium]
MPYHKTEIEGLWVFEPKVFEDSRGYFFESFNKNTFQENTGLNIDFVQDNESKSVKGVLRGMHYQLNPMAQAKLVRVLEGEVQDVAIDMRRESPTYGKHFSINLSAQNRKQLFIPRGFAHGFLVLSETAVFAYKCDNYYSKENEGGLLWNDTHVGIDWQLEEKDLILSEKDNVAPSFDNALNNF